MIEFLIALVLVLCFVGWFIISNLLNQIQQLEETIQNASDIEQRALNVYNFLLELYVNTYAELQEIDKRGSFSSDDEVGFVFRVIMESIEQVKTKMQELQNTDIQNTQ